jgi:hypothetical protein
MGNKGCFTIPRTLLENITYLSRALPLRSVPTFIELLIGAMIRIHLRLSLSAGKDPFGLGREGV